MTAAYSQDLRNRVIDAVEKEGMHRLAAANFLTTSRARSMRLRRSAQPMKKTGCRRETNEAAPQEPNLSDVLNDPIVMAVMRADGVSPDGLARMLGIPVCRAAFRSARLREGEEA
jgi:hypothetical protein